MVVKTEKTKEQRVKSEFNKIKRLFKDLPADMKTLNDGLLNRAAFMRVELEDMEMDLAENGFTELFAQSEHQAPYYRQRPIAQLYNTLNKNYQSLIKQLGDRLPKPEPKPKDEDDDGFESFVAKR